VPKLVEGVKTVQRFMIVTCVLTWLCKWIPSNIHGVDNFKNVKRFRIVQMFEICVSSPSVLVLTLI